MKELERVRHKAGQGKKRGGVHSVCCDLENRFSEIGKGKVGLD